MNRNTAIRATHPNVVTIRDDVAYDENENIIQYNESVVQAYINDNRYKQQRAMEYPSMSEQLDMLYHDKINNTETWLESIQAVKNKYPKS